MSKIIKNLESFMNRYNVVQIPPVLINSFMWITPENDFPFQGRREARFSRRLFNKPSGWFEKRMENSRARLLGRRIGWAGQAFENAKGVGLSSNHGNGLKKPRSFHVRYKF
ncbi:MAG: hypothetical protein LBR53_12385 [Deltaproteobacteria bacterium]|nr:hypothetical protein [Deltaproteobacteria bacterium]